MNFLKFFREDLLRVPPDRKLKFEIDLLLYTQHISIFSYRTAPTTPTKLKMLKEQLMYLLDKGFLDPVFLRRVLQSYSCAKKMVLSESIQITNS